MLIKTVLLLFECKIKGTTPSVQKQKDSLIPVVNIDKRLVCKSNAYSIIVKLEKKKAGDMKVKIFVQQDFDFFIAAKVS